MAFLVGGVISLVNSVNERDPCLLNSCDYGSIVGSFRGLSVINRRKLGAITGL